MPEETSFADLIRRVRAGDNQAARELVREYEPAIRRAVRIQLRDPRLRAQLDSVDICQSVLGSFFIRAASGQYDLDEPGKLIRLLAAMARNKLATQARRPQVRRRELLPADEGGAGSVGPVDPHASPSQFVAGKDLLEQFRLRLSEEERWLADQRTQGREWSAIAADCGGSPEALRKKWARALERVARELGLGEQADE